MRALRVFNDIEGNAFGKRMPGRQVEGAVMDNQQLFNVVVSIAGFLAVFVFNSTTRKIQKMEDRLAEMPKEYVAKDDYRSDISEVKAILKQIFEKLDNKADKS
jgi:cell fate (sporulation/competence/biofilm development) regulator YmcA (YheA/YmcA/DUF963 family)